LQNTQLQRKTFRQVSGLISDLTEIKSKKPPSHKNTVASGFSLLIYRCGGSVGIVKFYHAPTSHFRYYFSNNIA